jgi:hypothetical protein
MHVARASNFEHVGRKKMVDHSVFFVDFGDGSDAYAPPCEQAWLRRPGLPRLRRSEEAELDLLHQQLASLEQEDSVPRMKGRQLRSNTKGTTVPVEDVVGWEMHRLGDRFEWRSAEKFMLRQLIKDSNCALQDVVMEAPRGARRNQIRLDRGDLKAGVVIPFNAVVGTFPSDVHHEESGLIDVVPYREAILQGIRVTLRPHESQDVSTGYYQDLFLSNLWFARPNHIKPSVKLEWVSGGSAGKLFALRGRAAFDLEPGAELTVDLNQVCGNAMGDGPVRWLPYPTGPRALDMLRVRG